MKITELLGSQRAKLGHNGIPGSSPSYVMYSLRVHKLLLTPETQVLPFKAFDDL